MKPFYQQTLEPVERQAVSEMLSIADLTLVSPKPGFGNISVPSKILGYMAVGRSILAQGFTI